MKRKILLFLLLIILCPYLSFANMYMYYGPYKHSETYKRQHENDYKLPEPKKIELDGWGNLKRESIDDNTEEENTEENRDESEYDTWDAKKGR